MVGDKIRSARSKTGMTQKELADRVGISRAALNRIENSNVLKMKASTAFNIAKALRVPMDYLFCDECLQNEAKETDN